MEPARSGMKLHLSLPLDECQVIACVVAADRFKVEPWEIAVHVLALKQHPDLYGRRKR